MSRERFISNEDAYAALRSWRNSIEFMIDESRFFHDLLDKYFMEMLDEIGTENGQHLVASLNLFTNNDLVRCENSRKDLEALVDASGSTFSIEVRNALSDLAEHMKSTESEFRNIKKSIFQLVHGIIEN